MKRLYILICLITLLLTGVCNAEESTIAKKLNITSDSQEETTVTRGECLNKIMNCIGYSYVKIALADYIGFEDGNLGTLQYAECARRSGIAFGEKRWVPFASTRRSSHMKTEWDLFFAPDENVTVAQAVAFMVRCLGDYGDDAQNVNFCFNQAMKLNLILPEDSASVDSYLTNTYFDILVQRFLGQKRYRYYDYETVKSFKSAKTDDKCSITYREHLELCKNNTLSYSNLWEFMTFDDKTEYLSLTIYYVEPTMANTSQFSVDDLTDKCTSLIVNPSYHRIVIGGEELAMHSKLFASVDKNDIDYINYDGNDVYMDARLYFVISSRLYGDLLKVAMWNNDGSITVNGTNVESSEVLLDILSPFIPQDVMFEFYKLNTIKNSK